MVPISARWAHHLTDWPWGGGGHLNELLALPPPEPPPLSTDGLPDLEVDFDAAGVGDPCFPDAWVEVYNRGTASSARLFEVYYEEGDDRGLQGYRHLGTTVTVELYRPLEPGEGVQFSGVPWQSVVFVDPSNAIEESDEANNRREAPPDPGLECVTVITP